MPAHLWRLGIPPDAAERARVRSMRASGAKIADIAKALSTSATEIERRFQIQLREGAADFIASLRERLTARAAQGCPQARSALRELERALEPVAAPELRGGRGNGR